MAVCAAALLCAVASLGAAENVLDAIRNDGELSSVSGPFLPAPGEVLRGTSVWRHVLEPHGRAVMAPPPPVDRNRRSLRVRPGSAAHSGPLAGPTRPKATAAPEQC